MFRWLHAGAWVMLGLALVNLFFRFSDGTLEAETFFNADALYLPALYRDLVEQGGRWSGWRLTPAPYFFPDMPLYFAAEALSGSLAWAVLLFAAMQLVWVVLATQLLVRTVAPPGGVALGQVVAVCVVTALVVLYGTGTLYLMVFPVLSAYHFGAVLVALVALPLALRTFRGGARLAPWLLGALCFLASASDSIFVVLFTVPAAACFLLLALAWRPVPWRRLGLLVGILGGATLLGFRAARWLTNRRAGKGFTSPKLDLTLDSLLQLGASASEQARSSPGLAALWVAVTLAAVAVLVARRRQWTAPESPGWGVYAVCLFGVLALGANVSAVVLAGLFGDRTCFRYLELPVFFPFLGLALAAGFVPREAWRRWLGAGVLGAVAVGGAVTVARKPWRTEGPFITDYYPPLVACLDAHRERHGLEWGVADYWEAKPVSLFSRTGLWVNPVKPDGRVLPLITNMDGYLARRGEHSDYTFVITRQLDTEALQRKFGAPRESFRCEGIDVLVYGEALDATLRDAFADELKRPR